MTFQHEEVLTNVRKPAPDPSMVVMAFCWAAMFFEGYDMSALGAVLPGMLADPVWRLTPQLASELASAALVGMFFGGYGFGMMADRKGRKLTFLASLSLFSIASTLIGPHRVARVDC